MKYGYCGGKRSYSKKDAVAVGNAREKEDGVKLRVYECDTGDHWHLTKKLTFKKFYNPKQLRRRERHAKRVYKGFDIE